MMELGPVTFDEVMLVFERPDWDRMQLDLVDKQEFTNLVVYLARR